MPARQNHTHFLLICSRDASVFFMSLYLSSTLDISKLCLRLDILKSLFLRPMQHYLVYELMNVDDLHINSVFGFCTNAVKFLAAIVALLHIGDITWYCSCKPCKKETYSYLKCKEMLFYLHIHQC